MRVMGVCCVVADPAYVGVEGQVDEFCYNASRNMYVGNLPPDTDAAAITELFAPYGTILGAREPTPGHRFTYVEFTDVAAVVRAIEARDGDDFGGKKLSVNFGRYTMPADCLWIDHVAAAASEEDILQFAAQRPGRQ
jgi:hypothetical protein